MSYCFAADSAVLTGSLTWVKVDDENRTTARFSLTLSLSLSQYPTTITTPAAVVGERVPVPGAVVKYGDGDTTGEEPMIMEVQYTRVMTRYKVPSIISSVSVYVQFVIMYSMGFIQLADC